MRHEDYIALRRARDPEYDRICREHERLMSVTRKLPQDYRPYGTQGHRRLDCSCGCRWYIALTGDLAADWGVCTNPASHRVGLLTFEHQGCHQFEMDPDYRDPFDDDEEEADSAPSDAPGALRSVLEAS